MMDDQQAEWLREARDNLFKEVERLKRVVDDQQTEIERLTAKVIKYRSLQADLGEAWLWLNEEDNDLDSMCESMAIQITAGDLRGLITQQAVIDCRGPVDDADLLEADLAWAIVHEVCDINEETCDLLEHERAWLSALWEDLEDRTDERDRALDRCVEMSRYLSAENINEMRERRDLPPLPFTGKECASCVNGWIHHQAPHKPIGVAMSASPCPSCNPNGEIPYSSGEIWTLHVEEVDGNEALAERNIMQRLSRTCGVCMSNPAGPGGYCDECLNVRRTALADSGRAALMALQGRLPNGQPMDPRKLYPEGDSPFDISMNGRKCTCSEDTTPGCPVHLPKEKGTGDPP